MDEDGRAVGERVLRLRLGAGFYERTAACALGLPQEQYLRRESGEQPFTLEELQALAILFGCRVSDFLGNGA